MKNRNFQQRNNINHNINQTMEETKQETWELELTEEELDNEVQESYVSINQREFQADKKLKKTGWLMLGVFLGAIVCTGIFQPEESVNVSSEAKQALQKKVSTELAIGTKLMSNDEDITNKDYTITHSDKKQTTKIYIWDYAAEDGDYVQILVGGTAIGDSFMIKNKPIELEVPSEGEVEVLGIRDGGGGITYAIHYEINGTTYFNGTTKNESNLYTLVKQ